MQTVLPCVAFCQGRLFCHAAVVITAVYDFFHNYIIFTSRPLLLVIRSKPKFLLEITFKRHLLEVKKKVESWLYSCP